MVTPRWKILTQLVFCVKGQRVHHQLLHQCSSACLIPHSAAASAPGDAASAATLVQHSMPPSAAARASELPRHALDQARQENQLPDDTRTSETQIEASSRSPEILPCVSELKKLKSCNFSSKRQCSLPDVCTERCVVFVS
ncbi:uncharacterized protein LOC115980280 [Quercus lobata]|uniref:uncharacterized protein LOC115980280 n=1 Tax=Quercus lobata TaxID=97700 RepID=UPI001247C5C0|nr:uncharacterized protein LOC115980280 [Quercus lobata]